MTTRSIFGEDLTDYEIEIVLDNPAIAGWFEAGRNRANLLDRFQNDNSLRGKVIKFIGAAAKATGAIGAVKALLNSNREREVEEIDEGRMVRRRPREIEVDEEGNIIPPEGERPATRPRGEETALALPDLGDLIPENDGRGTSGNMEEVGGDVEMALARSGGGGGITAPSKETPISQYPSLTYGLQNTHTTVLPWRSWSSFSFLDKENQQQQGFRMNAPYDMRVQPLVDLPSGAGAAAKAEFNRPVNGTGINTAGVVFPRTSAAGAAANERPQWRDYWAQLYEYYTVLGCEWKVTISNVGANIDSGILVGVQYDSYSDTSGPTSSTMPYPSALAEALAYEGMMWHHVDKWNTNQEATIISGKWKPGDVSHNIVNDGDVKTWTPTGSIPNEKVLLTLNWWQDELSHRIPQEINANVKVELKYIVQFKDLRMQARYPNSKITDQDIAQYIDNDITDNVRYIS